MFDLFREGSLQVLGIVAAVAAILASGHAVLYKADTRAAVGWVAAIWLAPLAGPIAYALFGINRIRRRGAELLRGSLSLPTTTEELRLEHEELSEVLPSDIRHLASLGNVVGRVTRMPFTTGNSVSPLVNGDRAFPEMVRAIDEARSSVGLYTYIFDNDRAGRMFLDALDRAVQRGVSVRVLIDGVGARYSWPPIVKTMRKRGIPVERFLHSVVPWRMPYMNLRSHRKILVVDGRVGYTGGMNIRAGHLMAEGPKSPVQDVHFRVTGPVVGQMMTVFAEDWAFTCREVLNGDAWFPPIDESGTVIARGISDGPDLDLYKLRWTMLGALAEAEKRVRIVTPYFLPDSALITALNVTALRGVDVQIVIPEVNNLPYVKWAMDAQLWRVLVRGCRVILSPRPFDHSKLMVVDGAWSLIGSANWDPRSLRLNFEFNLECFCPSLASALEAIVDDKVARGREVTLADVDGRPLPIRLRDGLARLASPYL